MTYWVLTVDDDHQRSSTSIHRTRGSAEQRLTSWFTDRGLALPTLPDTDLVEWANEQENEGPLHVELISIDEIESLPNPLRSPEDLVAMWTDEDFISDPELAKAAEFIRDCVAVIGGGFHPDTSFEDYIVIGTGTPLFSVLEAEQLNEVLAEACHELPDPYGIALDAIHQYDAEQRKETLMSTPNAEYEREADLARAQLEWAMANVNASDSTDRATARRILATQVDSSEADNG